MSFQPNQIVTTIIAGSFFLPLMTSSSWASDGAELFEENCASCHLGSGSQSERTAPPIFGVRNHYIQAYPKKEEFVSAVVKWLEEPNEAASLMPGAISRFELMPQIEVSADDAEKIAEYIHAGDFNEPGWYKEHYKQEHGENKFMQKGMGKAMSKGNGHGKRHGQNHEGKGGFMNWLFGSDDRTSSK